MRTLFHHIAQLVQPHLNAASLSPVDVQPDAALLVEDGLIIASGPEATVRSDPRARDTISLSLEGRAVVPGFVDSHTHLVFAQPRIDEMARRCRGESYEAILEAGGGIFSSAARLAQTSFEILVESALARVARLHRLGTTTVEIKSGYGLAPGEELRQLRVIAEVRDRAPIAVRATALAHVIPAEWRERRSAYVDAFITEVLHVAAKDSLATYADVFVEGGAFGADEATRLAHAAKGLGLGLKLHVDQLRDGAGAHLAARLGALSADHLEYTSADGAAALAAAGTVATVLPGCALFLGKGPWPNARLLRDAGCQVAIATDCNPGSSMVFDLALCGTLAATRCGLSLEEALWGMTRGGALALGLQDRGTLRAGERADFVVVDSADWRALLYQPGQAPIGGVAVAGQLKS